jgi:hypothetical protein
VNHFELNLSFSQNNHRAQPNVWKKPEAKFFFHHRTENVHQSNTEKTAYNEGRHQRQPPSGFNTTPEQPDSEPLFSSNTAASHPRRVLACSTPLLSSPRHTTSSHITHALSLMSDVATDGVRRRRRQRRRCRRHWNHESTATVGAIKASNHSAIKVLYHCVTTCLEKERSLATLPPLPPLLPPPLLLPRAPFL